jgi:hypothetical protein
MGPILQKWLDEGNEQWKLEVQLGRRRRTIGRRANAQADAEWRSLIAVLNELKGVSFRGTSFSFAPPYGLPMAHGSLHSSGK